MAKFARVGYGSDGRGLGSTEGQEPEGYTYLVNDNVRTGDTLYPAVRHYKNKNIYGTTGRVLSTVGENTAKGQEERARVESESREGNAQVRKYYTGKELGVGKATRFTKEEYETRGKSLDGTSKKQEKEISTSGMASRGGNVLATQRETGGNLSKTDNVQKSVQTFEEYSKDFM